MKDKKRGDGKKKEKARGAEMAGMLTIGMDA
jgi:hypothetical protein